MAGQKPKCFIMLAGPNILIYLANYLFWISSKFLLTLLWNLMLTFVHFNSNFSHISDIVQTDYLSIINIFVINHLQYTFSLMCSIPLIMITSTHTNIILLLYGTKMFPKWAGQMPTHFNNHNEFHSTLTWILWSLLLIWSLHLQYDYFISLWEAIKV